MLCHHVRASLHRVLVAWARKALEREHGLLLVEMLNHRSQQVNARL